MEKEQEQVKPITDQELLHLCRNLAGRFKNQNHYEDLVSEGLLACYELKESGCDLLDAYASSARRAMNDYINIKVKAVNTPSTWASRRACKAVYSGSEVSSLSGVAEGTFVSLMAAMANVTEGLAEDTSYTPDHAVSFEEKQYHKHVLDVATKTLSPTEMQIIKMRYLQGMTQDIVAELTQTNQKWVSRHEKGALAKLRETLCNNL